LNTTRSYNLPAFSSIGHFISSLLVIVKRWRPIDKKAGKLYDLVVFKQLHVCNDEGCKKKMQDEGCKKILVLARWPVGLHFRVYFTTYLD
jgi:hypothetical protein